MIRRLIGGRAVLYFRPERRKAPAGNRSLLARPDGVRASESTPDHTAKAPQVKPPFSRQTFWTVERAVVEDHDRRRYTRRTWRASRLTINRLNLVVNREDSYSAGAVTPQPVTSECTSQSPRMAQRALVSHSERRPVQGVGTGEGRDNRIPWRQLNVVPQKYISEGEGGGVS